MKRLFKTLVALTLMTASAQAQLNFDQATERYFFAEDALNGSYLALGAATMGMSAYLVTWDSNYAKSAAYPLMAVGAIQFSTGVAFLFVNAAIQKDLLVRHKDAPQSTLKEEQRRMDGVNRLFPYYKTAEALAALTGVGLIALGRNDHDSTLLGVGMGLCTAAIVQLGLEHMGAHIGGQYSKDLSSIQLSLGVGTMTLIGTFQTPLRC
ncbi:MAG TPA: hypothetical protein EYN06_00630 [Myxococcales bacterium]|nr:hypothetical protein [Myxococcales bacterium]